MVHSQPQPTPSPPNPEQEVVQTQQPPAQPEENTAAAFAQVGAVAAEGLKVCSHPPLERTYTNDTTYVCGVCDKRVVVV